MRRRFAVFCCVVLEVFCEVTRHGGGCRLLNNRTYSRLFNIAWPEW